MFAHHLPEELVMLAVKEVVGATGGIPFFHISFASGECGDF